MRYTTLWLALSVAALLWRDGLMPLAAVLAALALSGCASTLPEGMGRVPADDSYQCPDGLRKVCERPGAELRCWCRP